MPTFDLHLARDGEMFISSYAADDEDGAQALALADINRAWREDYASFDDLVADSYGYSLYERDDGEMIQLYRDLADGLSDMIQGNRISCPDDHTWLIDTLAGIAAADSAAL